MCKGNKAKQEQLRARAESLKLFKFLGINYIFSFFLYLSKCKGRRYFVKSFLKKVISKGSLGGISQNSIFRNWFENLGLFLYWPNSNWNNDNNGKEFEVKWSKWEESNLKMHFKCMVNSRTIIIKAIDRFWMHRINTSHESKNRSLNLNCYHWHIGIVLCWTVKLKRKKKNDEISWQQLL